MPFDHGPLQNQVPFIRLRERQSLRSVCQHYGSAIVTRWDALSGNEKCILEGLLQPDPGRRWNMMQVKQALDAHEMIETPMDFGFRYRSKSAEEEETEVGVADEPAAPLVPVRRQRGGPIGLVREPRLATAQAEAKAAAKNGAAKAAKGEAKPALRKSKRGRDN